MSGDLDHEEVRDGVRRLCADFPGEYWRRCDREQAYPEGLRRGLDPGRLPGVP